MNALISYLRHAIVTWLLVILEKYQFPVEGLEDAVNLVVLTALGTLSWAFVKYVAPYLKEPKAIAMLIIGLSTITVLPSCAGTTRSPLTGINYTNGKPSIDETSQTTLLWRLSQLISGVKPKDIIKEALPVVDPAK